MNRIIYFLVPFLALLAFGGYYFGVYHKALVAAQAEAQRVKDEEDARIKVEKEAAEKEAIAQAALRTQQKRDEEEAKRKQDEDKQAAEDKKLADAVKTAEDRSAALTSEHAQLEITLLETRRQREAEEKKAFELSRQVELAKIERRNAELEIQLNTEKMATRVEASSMVKDLFPPPLTTTPAPTPR